MATAVSITKPYTITFDEAGTPTSFPSAIGSFYAADYLVTFGIGITFANYNYTRFVLLVNTPTSPGAYSGTKYAFYQQTNGAVTIDFAAALATRKVTFRYQSSGLGSNMELTGSNGEFISLPVTMSGVSSWTLHTIDLDALGLWPGSFLVRMNIPYAATSVMAIENLTVF